MQVMTAIFVSLVFGVSVVTKVLDFKAASGDVASLGVRLPKAVAPLLTALLIAAEVASVCCAWFLLGHWFACVPAALLMAFCTAVAVQKYFRGERGCRCFGHLSSASDMRWRAIANAVGVLICSLGVARLWPPHTAGDVVVFATIGLVSGMSSVFIDQVLNGFARSV